MAESSPHRSQRTFRVKRQRFRFGDPSLGDVSQSPDVVCPHVWVEQRGRKPSKPTSASGGPRPGLTSPGVPTQPIDQYELLDATLKAEPAHSPQWEAEVEGAVRQYEEAFRELARHEEEAERTWQDEQRRAEMEYDRKMQSHMSTLSRLQAMSESKQPMDRDVLRRVWKVQRISQDAYVKMVQSDTELQRSLIMEQALDAAVQKRKEKLAQEEHAGRRAVMQLEMEYRENLFFENEQLVEKYQGNCIMRALRAVEEEERKEIELLEITSLSALLRVCKGIRRILVKKEMAMKDLREQRRPSPKRVSIVEKPKEIEKPVTPEKPPVEVEPEPRSPDQQMLDELEREDNRLISILDSLKECTRMELEELELAHQQTAQDYLLDAPPTGGTDLLPGRPPSILPPTVESPLSAAVAASPSREGIPTIPEFEIQVGGQMWYLGSKPGVWEVVVGNNRWEVCVDMEAPELDQPGAIPPKSWIIDLEYDDVVVPLGSMKDWTVSTFRSAYTAEPAGESSDKGKPTAPAKAATPQKPAPKKPDEPSERELAQKRRKMQEAHTTQRKDLERAEQIKRLEIVKAALEEEKDICFTPSALQPLEEMKRIRITKEEKAAFAALLKRNVAAIELIHKITKQLKATQYIETYERSIIGSEELKQWRALMRAVGGPHMPPPEEEPKKPTKPKATKPLIDPAKRATTPGLGKPSTTLAASPAASPATSPAASPAPSPSPSPTATAAAERKKLEEMKKKAEADLEAILRLLDQEVAKEKARVREKRRAERAKATETEEEAQAGQRREEQSPLKKPSPPPGQVQSRRDGP